jgi:SAM-dependent methyltransferase
VAGDQGEHLQDLLTRLERERDEADRRYNDALTALDRSVQPPGPMPDPPPAYDTTKLPAVNEHWNILAAGAPAADRSLKGRLRGFIWRLVGPPLESQRHFNAALVDHLNRNVATHVEAERASATTIAVLRQQADALTRFQTFLIQYLQTITLYIDTKDRAVGGQAQVINSGVNAISDDWLKRWESLGAREQRFVARAAAVDDLRATVSIAQQTALSLKREVERLITSGATGTGGTTGTTGTPGISAAPDLDSYKYLGFEDAFRGSTDDIRDRLASYLPLFDGQRDVLDVGCGRGEFLELLRQRGISARGLDLNHEMVETSRARGLEVAEGDALGYLQSLPDDSLGGIFAAQVVEHLEPGYLMRVLEAAAHKMRPGGVIVLETINPACWLAFFESFLRDVTHVWPLHPDTLQYLMRASGFGRVEIEYRSPVAEASRLQPVPGPPAGIEPALADLVETFNENVSKLNARMFTFQDYAAIGRK